MYVNNAYFGAQCMQIGPTLGYLEPQGKDDEKCEQVGSQGVRRGILAELARVCRESPQMLRGDLHTSTLIPLSTPA